MKTVIAKSHGFTLGNNGGRIWLDSDNRPAGNGVLPDGIILSGHTIVAGPSFDMFGCRGKILDIGIMYGAEVAVARDYYGYPDRVIFIA